MKALVVALALVCMVGVAHASPNDVIQACANKKTGVLRINNTIAGCLKTETALSWSQVGPQGPQGPAGTPGTTSTPTLRMESGVYAPEAEDVWINIPCPGDLMAIGGTAWISDGWNMRRPLAVELTENGGFRGFAHVDWEVPITNGDAVFYNIICGTV